MCNWAVNEITFSSRNSKLLKELHKKVLSCYDAADSGHNLVKDLMKAHGYYVPFRVNNSDYISACDEFVTSKKGVYYFQCETTTVGEENMLPITIMLAEQYHNKIRLSFCTEEPGFDLYLVKDETGIFYPTRFKVDWCMDDNYETEYFEEIKDMIAYLKKYFPKANFSCYDTLSDIKDSIDLVYGDADAEYFCSIFRFKEYHNDQERFILFKEAA